MKDGLILIGRTTTGTIQNLPAGGEQIIYSGWIIGLGEVDVEVNALEPYGSADFRRQSGKVFGIYILVRFGSG